MNTETRQEQRSRLDEFAKVNVADASTALAPMMPAAQAPAIFGAQQLAVKRDTAKVLTELKVLAAAAGEDWYYRFPVKNRKENRTDWIEGPSVKLANDLARIYGNCEVDCRAQDLGSYILFHARFVDLETGYALTRPFQQRKGAAKMGGSDEGRREDITFQIGASKAIRNVVVNALQTMADFAFREAKEALVDRIGSDLERWRTRASERISGIVALDRVEAVIGRKASDWLAPDIARVVAMGKAISDGMASVDETFPPLRQVEEPDERAMMNRALDQIAGGVVDERPGDDAPQSQNVAEPAAAPPSTDPPSDEHAGAAAPDPDKTRARETQEEMISKLLTMAQDAELTVQERLENLENLTPGLHDMLPEHGKFVDTALNTAAKVARGQLQGNAAQKYLAGLVTP